MRVRAKRRHWSVIGAAAIVAGFVATASPASAEDGFHPLDSTLEFMNLKTQAGKMPDFVEQSHRDVSSEGYMPVGGKPVDRSLKVKSPAEVKAATAELDAARAAQLAGKRPKPTTAAASTKVGRRKTATSR